MLGLVLIGARASWHRHPGVLALGEAVATLSDPVDPDFVREFQLIYPDAGHALHWEEPQRFAADLAAFVARAVARDRFAA